MNVGDGREVKTFLGRIVHQDRLPSLCRASSHALTHFHAQAVRDFGRIPDVETKIQLLTLLIQQQDGKNFVVDDFTHEFRHPLECGFKVERGIHHVGDFKQEGLHLGGEFSFRGGSRHKLHHSSRLERPSTGTLHSQLQIVKHANIRKIAVALRVVEAITDDVSVWDCEPNVLGLNRLLAARRLIQQCRNAK